MLHVGRWCLVREKKVMTPVDRRGAAVPWRLRSPDDVLVLLSVEGAVLLVLVAVPPAIAARRSSLLFT